jgi:hypothetical protein
MTLQGPNMMYRVERKMNQNMHIEILEQELIHMLHTYDLDLVKVIFQHDNNSKCISRSVHSWLNLQEFFVLKRLIQSLCMNTIEHLWSFLKHC